MSAARPLDPLEAAITAAAATALRRRAEAIRKRAADGVTALDGSVSVELDAIPPNDLRAIVEAAIETHLPPEQYAVLNVAEESEQKLIHGLVGMLKSQTGPAS